MWYLWKKKTDEVSLMGFEHVVSCLCECEVKARQELDEKMQREEAQRQLIRENPSDFGKEDSGNGNLKMTMEATRRY